MFEVGEIGEDYEGRNCWLWKMWGWGCEVEVFGVSGEFIIDSWEFIFINSLYLFSKANFLFLFEKLFENIKMKLNDYEKKLILIN